MATLNKGILTNGGLDLFNKAQAGDIKITYTKVIFCDAKQLLNMNDDDIEQLTDITPDNYLESIPVVYSKGADNSDEKQGTQVVIRSIASNEGEKDGNGNIIQAPLTDGFYPYVSALFASDGTKEILYGIYLNSQPGFMPPYDGKTPQPLEFTWQLLTSKTDNFTIEASSSVYATIEDLNNINHKYQDFAQQTRNLVNSNLSLVNSGIASYSSNISSLSESASSGFNYTNSYANSLGQSVGSSASVNANSVGSSAVSTADSYTDSKATNLQQQITDNNNSHDSAEGDLQQQITSNKNNILSNTNIIATKANDTLNQANNHTDNKTNDLQNQITQNKTDLLSNVVNLSQVTEFTGDKNKPMQNMSTIINFVKGKTYYISFYADNAQGLSWIGSFIDPYDNMGRFEPALNSGANNGNYYITHWTCTENAQQSLLLYNSGNRSNQSKVHISKICVTQSDNYVPFEIAQRNREIQEAADKLPDLQNQVTSNKNSILSNYTEANSAATNAMNQANAYTDSKIELTSNEQDAKDKSNQDPNTLFVYSD